MNENSRNDRAGTDAKLFIPGGAGNEDVHVCVGRLNELMYGISAGEQKGFRALKSNLRVRAAGAKAGAL